jgi:hypothetical protein
MSFFRKLGYLIGSSIYLGGVLFLTIPVISAVYASFASAQSGTSVKFFYNEAYETMWMMVGIWILALIVGSIINAIHEQIESGKDPRTKYWTPEKNNKDLTRKEILKCLK